MTWRGVPPTGLTTWAKSALRSTRRNVRSIAVLVAVIAVTVAVILVTARQRAETQTAWTAAVPNVWR